MNRISSPEGDADIPRAFVVYLVSCTIPMHVDQVKPSVTYEYATTYIDYVRTSEAINDVVKVTDTNKGLLWSRVSVPRSQTILCQITPKCIVLTGVLRNINVLPLKCIPCIHFESIDSWTLNMNLSDWLRTAFDMICQPIGSPRFTLLNLTEQDRFPDVKTEIVSERYLACNRLNAIPNKIIVFLSRAHFFVTCSS